jgi:hypothetical protein
MQAKQIRSLVLSTFFMAATVFSTGCVQKGPAQQAGENIDRAVENMQDVVDPPGPVERAGRDLDRAIEDATE